MIVPVLNNAKKTLYCADPSDSCSGSYSNARGIAVLQRTIFTNINAHLHLLITHRTTRTSSLFLAMQHAEDFQSKDFLDSEYFGGYEDVNVHRVMLSDNPRMEFYRSILSDPSIVGGKVIIDVGSGTGILSTWAAQAGAAHVFSIEASSMALLQPSIFEENEVQDRVTPLHTTVEELATNGVAAFIEAHPFLRQTEGVAVVVSEWMGFYLLHEGMLPSVLLARDFFRSVNKSLGTPVSVAMIPTTASIMVAPINLRPLYEEHFASFWSSVSGVRMETLGRMAFKMALEEASPLVEVLPPRCLLCEGVEFWRENMNTVEASSLRSIHRTQTFDFSGSTIFKKHLERDGKVVVDGFATWFRVSYGDHILDTSPQHPPSHWKQTSMLLPAECREEEIMSFRSASERVAMTLSLDATSPGQRCYTIGFKLH